MQKLFKRSFQLYADNQSVGSIWKTAGFLKDEVSCVAVLSSEAGGLHPRHGNDTKEAEFCSTKSGACAFISWD
jgi:hypothetical protein